MPPTSAIPQEATVVMDAAFEVDASDVLDVNVPGAHVRLRPHAEDGRVQVHGFVPDDDPERAHELFDRRGIATHQASDRLYVFGDRPSDDADGWRWRRDQRTAAHLDVRVPAGMDVEAHLPGGAVDASGLSGTVELAVTGGSVEATDLQGPLLVQGSGDSLAVRGCTGSPIDLQWAAGRVALEQIAADSTTLRASAAPVDVQTLQGSLDLTVHGASATLHDVTGRCTVQVRGGTLTYRGAPQHDTSLTATGASLRAALPPSLNATVTLDGAPASLDDAFSFDGERTPHHVEGRLNGGGPILRLQAIRADAHCTAQ